MGHQTLKASGREVHSTNYELFLPENVIYAKYDLNLIKPLYLFTEIWGIGEQIIWHHKVAISQKQNAEYSINNLVFYSDTY